MTKKKIVTTEEIEAETVQTVDAGETVNISPEVSELLDYMEGIAGTANLVKIYKVVEGVKAYCGRCEPGTLNEDSILKKWGAGSYYLCAFANSRFRC